MTERDDEEVRMDEAAQSVARRIRNAAYELATAMLEAERAKFPPRLKSVIHTAAVRADRAAARAEVVAHQRAKRIHP